MAGVKSGMMSAEATPIPAENDLLPVPRDGRNESGRANFLPYPVSTLGPAIVPNDLSTFRQRGRSEVEKRLRQQLVELHDAYTRAVDQFNWNSLVYASEFRFDPVVGETYHLYQEGGRHMLSMIGPGDWGYEHVGSFRLNVDRCWEVVRLADGVDREKIFGAVAG